MRRVGICTYTELTGVLQTLGFTLTQPTLKLFTAGVLRPCVQLGQFGAGDENRTRRAYATAWKAVSTPCRITRLILAPRVGIEPTTSCEREINSLLAHLAPYEE